MAENDDTLAAGLTDSADPAETGADAAPTIDLEALQPTVVPVTVGEVVDFSAIDLETATLVPQGSDLLVILADGSAFLFLDFIALVSEGEIPMLQLADGSVELAAIAIPELLTEIATAAGETSAGQGPGNTGFGGTTLDEGAEGSVDPLFGLLGNDEFATTDPDAEIDPEDVVDTSTGGDDGGGSFGGGGGDDTLPGGDGPSGGGSGGGGSGGGGGGSGGGDDPTGGGGPSGNDVFDNPGDDTGGGGDDTRGGGGDETGGGEED
ncbi:MAG: hypothetical protein RIM84_18550 [Alphaproteobacteria bacterium]